MPPARRLQLGGDVATCAYPRWLMGSNSFVSPNAHQLGLILALPTPLEYGLLSSVLDMIFAVTAF